MRTFAIDVLGLRDNEHDSDELVELITADSSRSEVLAAGDPAGG
jgi:hypothetical protein